MIVKTKTGNVIEGSPKEIATYFKEMTGRTKRAKRSGSDPRETKKKPSNSYALKGAKRIQNGTKKASWTTAELKMAVRLANDGKTDKQIARKLFKDNHSPIKRTPSAVNIALHRLTSGHYSL